MVVLGVSGFEDNRPMSASPVLRNSFASGSDALRFGDDFVPLQYFPLQLIGHDCSAALLVDGELVAFASEERFSRRKHGLNLCGRSVLPRAAIRYCLEQAGLNWQDIDYVAHFCDFSADTMVRRIAALKRNLSVRQAEVLERQSMDLYAHGLSRDVVLAQFQELSGEAFGPDRFVPVEHHLAHAAGAFYSSGFPDALIVTADGFGETESGLVAHAFDGTIEVIGRIHLPTSLGLLYQVITYYLGFRSYGDEYKVMGLSSYGDRSAYQKTFRDLVDLRNDGTYVIADIVRPDLGDLLRSIFGTIEWHNGFSQKAADIAAGLQGVLELTLMHTLEHFRRQVDSPRLCLAGGVALNATANGVIKRSGLFDRVFIQPAAGDDGTSLGATFYVDRCLSGRDDNRPITHTFWGPSYTECEVERALRARTEIRWHKDDDIIRTATELLAEGKLVGWFQGRMEMGPRALGARSILCDPRKAEHRDRLNRQVKGRESFRPFAPAVLEEDAGSFFELNGCGGDPFMITTVPVRAERREQIPAVVHVDGTSRLQTVTGETNPKFYRLLQSFSERTGFPLLLNTSFNHAGEPIVCSPSDAVDSFLRCGLDALIIEDYLVLPAHSPGVYP